MKLISSILAAILLSGLFAQGAAATVITVQVTAHVIGWGDQTGVFGGQIALGQAVTGTYTYDTSTTPQNSSGTVEYIPASPPANITVSAGGLTFQSTSSSMFAVLVNKGTGSSGAGLLDVQSLNNKPLASGASVNEIELNFMDPSGQWPASVALPTTAPALQNLSASRIIINGNFFSVSAQIDSVALLPAALDVSPASGSLVTGQRFDIALLLPPGKQIATMQGSFGGSFVPQFLYPGAMCGLGPQNSAGRQVILCPNGNTFLAMYGAGAYQVNWQVTLTDGTVLQQNVEWNWIQ